MKKGDLEFRVGVFVLAALAILAYMAIRAGDLYMRPGYTVLLMFDSVSGVDRGSPIKLAGVPIGEVKKIRALRNEEGKLHVEIQAFIEDGFVIEEDAQMHVATMGFLGEKYIEILPGTPGSKPVEPQGALIGRQLTGVDDLFESGQQLIQKMEYMVGDLREVVGDPEFKQSLKGTFVNGDKLMQNLESATADLKETMASARVVMGRLRDGEGTVGRFLTDEKIYKDLEALVADIKKNPWKLLKKG